MPGISKIGFGPGLAARIDWPAIGGMSAACRYNQSMSIHLSRDIEEQLRRLANVRGANGDRLADEAVQRYLVSCAITDVSAEDMARSQAELTQELPQWQSPGTGFESDAAR